VNNERRGLPCQLKTFTEMKYPITLRSLPRDCDPGGGPYLLKNVYGNILGYHGLIQQA
jgi:hypothetical protein